MRKTYLLLVIILTLFGCGTSKYVTTPILSSDTVYIKEILRDTIVQTQIQREYIETSTPDTISVLNTQLAKSTAKISQNTLYHTLEQKDTTIPIKIVYKDRVEYKTQYQEKPIYIEKEKPIRDNLFWYSIIGNIIVILYIAIKIFAKLKGVL